MENKYFPRKFKVYLPLIVLTVLLVFLLPTASKFKYDYKKGEPWMYDTLVSKFDFPILKTDSQMAEDIEKVSSNVIPCYKHDASVFRRIMAGFRQTDLGDLEPHRQKIASELTDIYSKGVIAAAPLRDSTVSRVMLIQRARRTVKQPVLPCWCSR